MALTLIDRYRGCLLGLACGDAVGTTVEFCRRGSFTPVTDMVGGGPFHLRAGQWTDDTSMALCLAESLLAKQGFDAGDQAKRYVDWWQNGYWSSTGACFDIGFTVRGALARFLTDKEPFSGSTDPATAGNGSIMRLAPVALYYYPDHESVREHALLSSRVTHGAPEALDSCALLAEALCRAFSGATKSDMLTLDGIAVASDRLKSVAGGGYRTKSRDQIRGTGYVVDSIEAAFWCFANTDDFSAAVLTAANLGEDADTTAAVVGQVAGAFYGETGIPSAWLKKIFSGNKIGQLAEALLNKPRPRT